MTQMFMGRAELMPAGESTEDHLRAKQEEAAIVERDKSNTDSRIGGLFRGCFRGHSIGRHITIQDVEDGVERCPNCAWELEEGYCDSCGINYGTDMESYYGDSIPSEFDQSETDMTVSDGFHEHDPGDFHDEPDFHTHQDPLNDWTGTGPAEVGDDISLDGDGQALHALNAYNGDFAFERAVAQALTGRPIRRNGSPVTAHTPRHYAPSMLSEVTTTYSEADGFSEMEGGDEVDESGEDVDEDNEEDDEDDEDSLSGFIVHDQDEEDHTLDCHLDRTRARLEDTDVQEQVTNFNRFLQDHSNLQYGVDDSAEETDSDGRPHLGNEVLSMENRVSSNSSNSSSEDEAPVAPQRSRKRRRIVHELSSEEESDSEEESVRSRPRRRLSSSGSATVGRQSPLQESLRAIPNRPIHRRRAPTTPAVAEPDSWESESELPPRSPPINNTSRRRRPNNRRWSGRPRRNRDNSNSANIHTSQSQHRARDNSSTTTYDSNNFSRMQPDLAPPPLAIRREGPLSRRRQNLRYV